MLKTAIVWFITSGAPNNGVYNFGTLGPFPTQERCEAHQKHLSKYLDKGFGGYPFRDRTKCLPVEIVIGGNSQRIKMVILMVLFFHYMLCDSYKNNLKKLAHIQ